MAWDDEMVATLRVLLQDTASPPQNADEDLARLLLVNAVLLQLKAAFPARYVANPSAMTLTPDPADEPRDEAFLVLCPLMAACTFVNAEIRGYARQSIEIASGDDRIKLARDPATLTLLARQYQKLLDDALFAHRSGGDAGIGQAIVGPYAHLYGSARGCPGDRDSHLGG